MAANDNSPAQDVAAPVLYSVYEPLTGPAGEEIPAFTIYCDGAPVAFTDAALPRDEQEHTARTFLAMHVMLRAMARITAEGTLDRIHHGVRGDRP